MITLATFMLFLSGFSNEFVGLKKSMNVYFSGAFGSCVVGSTEKTCSLEIVWLKDCKIIYCL